MTTMTESFPFSAAAPVFSAAAEEPAASSWLPAYDADPLTGEANRSSGRIVGVMVNNISYSERQNARPQRGLSSADLLIESKVEGGITRFCAVYRDADSIPEVGPMRSGRDQFLQLLMPWQALYYHDGESAPCTKFISVYNYSGLNIGGKSYFNTPTHPHVAHRDSRGRNVAYEHTEFTSGKEIKQAAGNAGIGLTYANETPFFHFADYRTAASNDLPGAPAAKTISITHSESYRTRLTYNSWGRSYKLEMYNRSKKAYENTVDELTGKQLTFDNVVVCFAWSSSTGPPTPSAVSSLPISPPMRAILTMSSRSTMWPVGRRTSSHGAACRWAAGRSRIPPIRSSSTPKPARR